MSRKPKRNLGAVAVVDSGTLGEAVRIDGLSAEGALPDLGGGGKKRVGNQTARKAAQILVAKNLGFGLTGAEVLVAQSLKKHFKFAFVNTLTNTHIELGLAEMFGRAKGIYPTWSILL